MKKLLSLLLCILLLCGCAATYDGPTQTVQETGCSQAGGKPGSLILLNTFPAPPALHRMAGGLSLFFA